MIFSKMDNALFTANTGAVVISTANSNLDGTGAVGLAYTARSQGSMINTIRIKSFEPCSAGMVRLFIGNSDKGLYLWIEVRVFGVDPELKASTFSKLLSFPRGSFLLLPNWSIYASTQVSNKFNVIVEGMDWYY